MSNGSACRRADTPPQPLAGPEATTAGQPDRHGGRRRQHGIPPKAHGRVLAAGGAQEQLIDALLTLARGHAGLDRAEPFDLASLARDVLDSRRAGATSLGLDIRSATLPALDLLHPPSFPGIRSGTPGSIPMSGRSAHSPRRRCPAGGVLGVLRGDRHRSHGGDEQGEHQAADGAEGGPGVVGEAARRSACRGGWSTGPWPLAAAMVSDGPAMNRRR
jgi:hypothetical protein